MIDLKLLREKPEHTKKSCRARGIDSDINSLLLIDKEWRKIKQQIDDMRHRRNKISLEISAMKKRGKDVRGKIKEIKELPEKIKKAEYTEAGLRKDMEKLLFFIPNILDKSVPVGKPEKSRIVRKSGIAKKINFKSKFHDQFEGIDLKRAAKLSGSGFYILTRKIAQLQRALIQFMLDYHVKDSFIEINAPQIVKPEIAFGTGNLPKFDSDMYKTREGLYLIPTAEVSITNLHAGEILSEKELPKKYVSFTQCYRTEAGKHGKETRGIFRLHEFEKVEMVCLTRKEDSFKALEEIRRRAEKILEILKIPYRTKILSSQDTGFASAKTYDIEAYSAASGSWLEVSSCSNCTDFQARRMGCKYQDSKGNLEFVHTLNGSGLALPRLLICLIENNQQKDGSIKIPSCLWKYTGFKKIEYEKKKTKK